MMSITRRTLSSLVPIIALALLSFAPRSVSSTSYVSLSGYSCGSNTGVYVSSFNVDCTQCVFGSTATVTMDFNVHQDQTEQANATVWLTKSYFKFLTLYSEREVNICSSAVSTGDTECPAAGSYEMSKGIYIPQYDGWVTSFQSHMTLHDTNGDLMLNCTATFTSGYQMYYTAAALLGGVSLLGLVFQRKWKNGRVVTEEECTNFEMMTDPHEVSKKSGVIV